MSEMDSADVKLVEDVATPTAKVPKTLGLQKKISLGQSGERAFRQT